MIAISVAESPSSGMGVLRVDVILSYFLKYIVVVYMWIQFDFCIIKREFSLSLMANKNCNRAFNNQN